MFEVVANRGHYHANTPGLWFLTGFKPMFAHCIDIVPNHDGLGETYIERFVFSAIRWGNVLFAGFDVNIMSPFNANPNRFVPFMYLDTHITYFGDLYQLMSDRIDMPEWLVWLLRKR